MAKRNREKLIEQSFYDLLDMMNANLKTKFGSACIMGALMTEFSEYERIKRCQKHEADCGKCIADWLNSFPI